MIKLNPAYLAGVLDSDGSFSVVKRNFTSEYCNYNAMIQLSWKKSDLTVSFMDSLTSEFGGSFAECKPTNTRKSFSDTKDYVKFCICGPKADNLARTVLPFLMLKKQQAQNIIKLRELTSVFKGRKQKLITEELHAIYLLNKSLNTKNGWKNA